MKQWYVVYVSQYSDSYGLIHNNWEVNRYLMGKDDR